MALPKLKSRMQTEESSDHSCSNATDCSENESSDSTHKGGNSAWADSISKVLHTTKPKSEKTVVLSRAKKLHTAKKSEAKPSYDFEVEGEIKEQKLTSKKSKSGKVRRNQPLAIRMKPTWKDIERERTLRKIATRGVVQLFNAVRTQQKQLTDQLEAAGPLDSRKDAVLKNINKKKFLDVLMSGNRAKSELIDNPVKNECKNESSSNDDESGDERKKSEWSVLKDDFMTNKKTKHWDEDSDNSEVNESSASTDDGE